MQKARFSKGDLAQCISLEKDVDLFLRIGDVCKVIKVFVVLHGVYLKLERVDGSVVNWPLDQNCFEKVKHAAAQLPLPL